MKLVVQLAANRGELDVEGDEVRVEGGALMLFREGVPVLVLASKTWVVVHPAGQGPKRPQPPLPEPEEPRILEQAVMPDTLARAAGDTAAPA